MNPNRVCWNCNDTGKSNYGDYYSIDCPYCKIHNSDEVKKERENRIKYNKQPGMEVIDIPF